MRKLERDGTSYAQILAFKHSQFLILKHFAFANLQNSRQGYTHLCDCHTLAKIKLY